MQFHWEKTIDNAKKTWERFPFVMLSATIAYVLSIFLAELALENTSNFSKKEVLITNYGYGIYLATLGIGLLFSFTLFGERNQWTNSKKMLVNVGIILFLIVLFFLFPTKMSLILAVQFFLWGLSTHLLAAFLPYFNKNENFGFWSYNQLILGRFILSAVFSGILYTGISLALVAIQVLFQADISPKIYIHVGLMCIYLHTWFFLAGSPFNFDELNEKINYPEFLGVLTRYVLLPLVSLYILILYAYAFRILMVMELPKGWVVYLILALSISGIFALLMIYPLQQQENEGWINIFTRIFYIALLPLLVLLFISIGVRVAQYGITENRYYVIALGLWLLGMCVHYVAFRRYQHIKIIPFSLFLIFSLSSFGPWSAFSVAEYSQSSRLYFFLQKNKMLNSKGKIIPSNDEISSKDSQEIINIIDFFENRDKLEYINNNLEKPIKLSKNSNTYEKQNNVLAYLNLKDKQNYFNQSANNLFENKQIISIDEEQKFFEVKGYDYFSEIMLYETQKITENFIDELDTKVTYNSEGELVLKINKKEYSFDLKETINGFIEKDEVISDKKLATIVFKKKDLKLKIYIKRSEVYIDKKTKKYTKNKNFLATIFWKVE
ncbi:MAG: DUF4153 domain-containing protein [Bacteroidetes bacterium]|nr:MAG: DUF4153 domain-containing protein [Bacteroidota bacterium]TAG85716.1 MAG: DUF4153 domain-containing protein [Bacteroidota bacterium]